MKLPIWAIRFFWEKVLRFKEDPSVPNWITIEENKRKEIERLKGLSITEQAERFRLPGTENAGKYVSGGGPPVRIGKRGGRYTEETIKDGRPYRRYF